MKLQDNKYITAPVAKMLTKDNWTMEKLATANPATLEKYKGIGKTTADGIVDEAQGIVNEVMLNEATILFNGPEIGHPVEELPPMSARVRRIKGQNQ